MCCFFTVFLKQRVSQYYIAIYVIVFFKESMVSKRTRKHLAQNRVQRSSSQLLQYDTSKDAVSVLYQMTHDRHCDNAEVRRIMMCAGAMPHDLFDTEGAPLQTARSILLHVLAQKRNPEFVPQLPTEIDRWMRTATIDEAALRHGRSSSTQRPATKNGSSRLHDVLNIGDNEHRVLLNAAAMYIMVRSYRSLSKAQKQRIRKTPLIQRLLMLDKTPDAPKEALKSVVHVDTSFSFLKDDELRSLFANSVSVKDIRKHLLLRRKRMFFHHRRLLNEHLIRNDGTLRSSIAEIAYAVKHNWGQNTVSDASVSKFRAVMNMIGKQSGLSLISM